MAAATDVGVVNGVETKVIRIPLGVTPQLHNKPTETKSPYWFETVDSVTERWNCLRNIALQKAVTGFGAIGIHSKSYRHLRKMLPAFIANATGIRRERNRHLRQMLPAFRKE